MISLSNLRFEAPECYFKPSLLGLSVATLPEAIATAISNCDYSLRKKLASNIILSGNSSLFPNMVRMHLCSACATEWVIITVFFFYSVNAWKQS